MVGLLLARIGAVSDLRCTIRPRRRKVGGLDRWRLGVALAPRRQGAFLPLTGWKDNVRGNLRTRREPRHRQSRTAAPAESRRRSWTELRCQCRWQSVYR